MKKYEKDDFNYYDEEEYLLENWVQCKCHEKDCRYKNCDGCKDHDECLENAQDNKDGYESFCDCIVGCGYDSMDEFWECNGI